MSTISMQEGTLVGVITIEQSLTGLMADTRGGEYNVESVVDETDGMQVIEITDSTYTHTRNQVKIIDSSAEQQTILPDDGYTGFSRVIVNPVDSYSGTYEIIPKPYEQILQMENKFMSDNVDVKAIPYFEVSNAQGGETVIIGGD